MKVPNIQIHKVVKLSLSRVRNDDYDNEEKAYQPWYSDRSKYDNIDKFIRNKKPNRKISMF